jgi:sodium/bile acid cotransporter 7
MGLPILYIAVSHLIILGLAAMAAHLIGLSREDRISVVFAAPQKTLAMGIPLLTTYFAGREELLGIAVIPLLFYHPFQLLVAGILKNVYSSVNDKA